MRSTFLPYWLVRFFLLERSQFQILALSHSLCPNVFVRNFVFGLTDVLITNVIPILHPATFCRVQHNKCSLPTRQNLDETSFPNSVTTMEKVLELVFRAFQSHLLRFKGCFVKPRFSKEARVGALLGFLKVSKSKGVSVSRSEHNEAAKNDRISLIIARGECIRIEGKINTFLYFLQINQVSNIVVFLPQSLALDNSGYTARCQVLTKLQQRFGVGRYLQRITAWLNNCVNV